MSRRHFIFDCEGARCAATLDSAGGQTGLLIVTGGNETRAGAFGGQANLAAQIAAAGHPVMRYDRRGVGDSEGYNFGFRDESADIAAALTGFRSEAPQVKRIVGFGNCDAASALMLAGGANFDALILSNPWTIETAEDEPPPAAIRSRYWEKLRNPKELLRLLSGKVALGGLARGLIQASRPAGPASSLAEEMARGISSFSGQVNYLIAERDRTGQAFLAAWKQVSDKRFDNIKICPDSSHAYVETHARQWLKDQILAALQD